MIAGDVEAVAEALALLQTECAAIGLTPQLCKSELVVPMSSEPSGLADHFPHDLIWDDEKNWSRVLCQNFEYLGAALGDDTFCETHANESVDAAQALLEKTMRFGRPTGRADPHASLCRNRQASS